MSRPPIAGPIARPRLMLAPPSVTACLSSCAGTSSGWIACQAGKLNVAPSPSAKVKPSSSERRDGVQRGEHGQPAGRHEHEPLRDQEQAPPLDHVGGGAGQRRPTKTTGR